MRDVNRIPRVLALVEKVWRANPDLRLCQLIYIAASLEKKSSWIDDYFYMEDEDLEKGLDKLYKSN